jgi:hypothetical protein
MTYAAKVAVCSEIHIKHSMKSEHRVEFLNVKIWWYVKKSLGFKGLTHLLKCCKIFLCENEFKMLQHTALVL